MATGKYKKKNQRTTDINPRGSIHNILVSMGNDSNKNERDVPFTLLLTLLVLCIVLIIALPVMGLMYLDMHNATTAALIEVRKMKELRLKILTEMQGK